MVEYSLGHKITKFDCVEFVFVPHINQARVRRTGGI